MVKPLSATGLNFTLPASSRRPGNAAHVGDAPGIGLGLHIVRNLVEAMGGTVPAESDAGAGTRFTVSLPGDASSASHGERAG